MHASQPHRLAWGAALLVVSLASCGYDDGAPRGPLLEGNASPFVTVTQPAASATDGGADAGLQGDGGLTGARFELLSAAFSAPLSPDGPRQLRVTGQVLDFGPGTVTQVTIRDATLVWSGGGVDVPFPPDAPNPTSVAAGSMAGPYFFIVTVQIPDFCANAAPSATSALLHDLVTISFTVSSNLFTQRLEDVDVGVECPPAPPLP